MSKKRAKPRAASKKRTTTTAAHVDGMDGSLQGFSSNGDGKAHPVDNLEKEIEADGAERQGRQEKGPSQAQQLLELGNKAQYVHDAEARSYAIIEADGKAGQHKETWPVRSAGFRTWLCREFYRATARAPSANALQDALGVFEARGRYDGDLREVAVRVGRHNGNIVLDLGDEPWRSIIVTPDGWTIANESPILFRRPRGLLALPEPVRGGKIEALDEFINIRPEHWPLVVGWLVASLFPEGPYPVLCLHGEQGTAKSTTARVLRSLVDPSKAPLRGVPRDERDLIISASNSWVLAMDNLSTLADRRSEWLSDALCRIATGGGYSTRELYADAEEMIFDVARPVILTGIEDLAARPDLIDRAVILNLPKIDGDKRRTEAAFWKQYGSEHPRILGALLDVLAGALRELPGVVLPDLSRMADFTVRAVAAGRALGWEDRRFLEAYEATQDDAVSKSLDESILKAPLWELMKEYRLPMELTWQDLLDKLTAKAGEKAKLANWPRGTRMLSGMIRRIAPNMRHAGYDVDADHRGPAPKRERMVRFSRGEKGCNSSSTSSTSSTGDHPPKGQMDGMDGMDDGLQGFSPSENIDGRSDAWERD